MDTGIINLDMDGERDRDGDGVRAVNTNIDSHTDRQLDKYMNK